MLEVLLRAGCFIAMIILGYVLKLLGVFKKEDFSVIARVVLKITLPAAIVVSMSGYTIDVSMLSIALIGLVGCGLQILLAFLLNLGRGRERNGRLLPLPMYPGIISAVLPCPLPRAFSAPWAS